ncbi:hypothetical protein RND71_002401 [Anisodus tanguticus]|uniref:Uncharacterized protein n=1 Tax=Anisodus tanguticus TaxID=243964 RepID=A0AAE1T2M0_9SOLA|nr:hypothetical protein RND71_002401 [Anisodus tanguticus]
MRLPMFTFVHINLEASNVHIYEVQFKFDRCLRFLQERVQDLPVFGIGHSLGSVIHLLIGNFVFSALPDVPPAMTDAVNRSSKLLANLTAGTPWENVTKEVGNTLGNVDSIILNSGNSKDLDMLVETITSWMYSN